MAIAIARCTRGNAFGPLVSATTAGSASLVSKTAAHCGSGEGEL
jgi:hypothetical protein